jgi:hypothetical protein
MPPGDGQWSLEFTGWLPQPPGDRRSPWDYVCDLGPGDRFATASDAMFSIYEARVRDPYGDGFVPIFRATARGTLGTA